MKGGFPGCVPYRAQGCHWGCFHRTPPSPAQLRTPGESVGDKCVTERQHQGGNAGTIVSRAEPSGAGGVTPEEKVSPTGEMDCLAPH